MAPLVRAAVPQDRDAVFALSTAMAVSYQVERSAFERAFALAVDATDVHLLVVEVDRTVEGYLLGFTHPTFFANGPVGWIEEIAVTANHRRAGLGTALMAAFESTARTRGCRLTALATRRAADFYRAIGYEAEAEYFRRVL